MSTEEVGVSIAGHVATVEIRRPPNNFLDVRIAGGAETIQEYLDSGLIDEFSIALSPVLFGSGIRLFEGVDAGRVALEPVRAEPTQRSASASE